jgi:flagellar FliL protein
MADEAQVPEDNPEEGQEEEGKKKKGGLGRGGLGPLVGKLLKFVAIGLGALIFIVTVAVITYNILNVNNPKGQTIVPENSPYIGTKPQYSYTDIIGTVRTNTMDANPYAVVVEMVLGYPLNDPQAQTEIIGRKYELIDFVRNYFSKKYAEELRPEHEEKIKQEIMEQLNTRILDTAKARNITFNQLSVMEM